MTGSSMPPEVDWPADASPPATATTTEVKTRDTIPFWMAVALTTVIFLPLAYYFGKYSVPEWVGFIVWAEYFTLGPKLGSLKTIIPAFTSGVFWGVVIGLIAAVLAQYVPGIVPSGGHWYIALFVGVSLMVFVMKYFKVFNVGSLPYFNGLTAFLAVYFVGAFPTPSTNAYVLVLIAAAYALAGGYMGAVMGWFNVTITFPRRITGR